MMLHMRTKSTELNSINERSAPAAGGDNEWEVRPGGMLVQRRDPDAEQNLIPHQLLEFGSTTGRYTMKSISALKPHLANRNHEDQKLMYKDKDRDSKTFLDVVGVKDRLKMVLVEDPISQEKRYLEIRKNAKMEKAAVRITEEYIYGQQQRIRLAHFLELMEMLNPYSKPKVNTSVSFHFEIVSKRERIAYLLYPKEKELHPVLCTGYVT